MCGGPATSESLHTITWGTSTNAQPRAVTGWRFAAPFLPCDLQDRHMHTTPPTPRRLFRISKSRLEPNTWESRPWPGGGARAFAARFVSRGKPCASATISLNLVSHVRMTQRALLAGISACRSRPCARLSGGRRCLSVTKGYTSTIDNTSRLDLSFLSVLSHHQDLASRPPLQTSFLYSGGGGLLHHLLTLHSPVSCSPLRPLPHLRLPRLCSSLPETASPLSPLRIACAAPSCTSLACKPARRMAQKHGLSPVVVPVRLCL